jgi:predicted enzyme related to lactoylglutathione lyase
VKHGPFDTPVGRIAVCTDDGGAFFYLMQPADAMKENR